MGADFRAPIVGFLDMQVEPELIQLTLMLHDTELSTGAGWGDSAVFEDSEFAPVSDGERSCGAQRRPVNGQFHKVRAFSGFWRGARTVTRERSLLRARLSESGTRQP